MCVRARLGTGVRSPKSYKIIPTFCKLTMLIEL